MSDAYERLLMLHHLAQSHGDGLKDAFLERLEREIEENYGGAEVVSLDQRRADRDAQRQKSREIGQRQSGRKPWVPQPTQETSR